MSSSTSADSGQENRLRSQLATANQQLTLCQADRKKLAESVLTRDGTIAQLNVDVAVARSMPLDKNVAYLTDNTVKLAQILKLPPGPTGNDPGPAVTLANLQAHAIAIMAELDRLRAK